MKNYLQYIIVLSTFVGIVFFGHSCANPGAGPSGGQKDTIPPVIVNMTPQPYATNVTSNEINISFNEYIADDKLSTKLVVSPPLAEKPSIKLKGKTIAIKFTEDLIPDRTYSVDLKDGIKDYNEGNKIESIRMLFSTYNNIDTLQIKGYLLDALSLAPVKEAYVTLYTLDVDSLFRTLRPDFIAKTDDRGFFMFDNLPEGKYRLYALKDIDNNLMYTNNKEEIAFIDSFIVPSAQFIPANDTIIHEGDTLIDLGHTHFLPDTIYAYLFLEEQYSQFITESKRIEPDQMLLTFNESLTDSFKLSLVNIDTDGWEYVEYNTKRDSVFIWITDSTLIKNDSLYLQVNYRALDSLNQPITVVDTLRMFNVKTLAKGKAKKTEEVEPTSFEFKTNLKTNNFDINIPIIIEAPMPVESLDSTQIKLEIYVNDTVLTPVPYHLSSIDGSERKYQLDYEPVEATKYVLTIDSATVRSRSGLSNIALELPFKTQKADFYGNMIINIAKLDAVAKVQLLQNSEKEQVLNELTLEPGQDKLTLNYVKPGKYRVKLFLDNNENGEWDTGSYTDKIQPEKVYYFPMVINVRSTWDWTNKDPWIIDPKAPSVKNIIDDSKKNDEE